MTCRECGKQFDSDETLNCPRCGAVRTAKSGVIKSSTILISAGETDAVYRSVKEVPAPLRRKLLKSTNGLNSATILIADRRGRQEIARAIQNLPSSLQRRYLKPFCDQPKGIRGWLAKPRVKIAMAALLTAASGVLIWFLFTHR
jgi:hypothetical protein